MHTLRLFYVGNYIGLVLIIGMLYIKKKKKRLLQAPSRLQSSTLIKACYILYEAMKGVAVQKIFPPLKANSACSVRLQTALMICHVRICRAKT